jgi:ribulose-phosphate 3-epimerase
MNLALGIKSDPVEYRYSYDWLFGFMRDADVSILQLGSSFEFYHLEDEFFTDLRRKADSYGIRIKSCFTAHRELGGFFTGDPRLETVARRNYERWIEIGVLLGADYVGSNPGAVYRDRPNSKAAGTAVFLEHLTELMHKAADVGLLGLCVEPMSSAFEPPSLPDEIDHFVSVAGDYHRNRPERTSPVYFCGDISHAVVSAHRSVEHPHWELFERELPNMAEFHFKNTDEVYGSTFGFHPGSGDRGIIRLAELREILERRKDDVPVDEFVGYLEIGGPKLGRDYSDPLLRDQLAESIEAIRSAFPGI